MRKNTYLIIMIATLLPLIAAGCSASGSKTLGIDSENAISAAAGNSEVVAEVHACDYLTKEIAAKYIPDVGDPTEENRVTVSTCNAKNEDLSMLSLLVRRSASDAEASAISSSAETESKTLSGVDPVLIDGLGDHAYWSGGNLKQLNVFIGHDWLILSGFMDGFNQDTAVSIMRDMLNK